MGIVLLTYGRDLSHLNHIIVVHLAYHNLRKVTVESIVESEAVIVTKHTSFQSKGSKIIFFSVGVINVLVFHYTLWRLWFFLLDSSDRDQAQNPAWGLALNLCWLLLFTVPHSLLLQAKVKKKIMTYMPQGLFGSIYSLHAGFGLLLMDHFWFSSPHILFQWTGMGRMLVMGLYALSWLFMFWTMLSMGLFRQSGIEEWWRKWRGQTMKNELYQAGPYRLCRHPIYAAFLGMIWTTPTMSLDHLILSVFWTGYIFIGVYLKERRLGRNKAYQNYRKQAPSFPFIPKKIDHYLSKKMGLFV